MGYYYILVNEHGEHYDNTFSNKKDAIATAKRRGDHDVIKAYMDPDQSDELVFKTNDY